MEFSWLYWWSHECVPNFHDAMNENPWSWSSCEWVRPLWRIHLWDSNAFMYLSCFVRVGRASFNAGGLFPPVCGTATFCVCVLAVWMRFSCNARHCWFHWIFQLLSGVLKIDVKFFNFARRNLVNLLLLACRLYFAALLSFEHIWT